MWRSECGSGGGCTPRVRHFGLGDGMQMQVSVAKASNDQNVTVAIVVRNSSRPLILHWGGIYGGLGNWVLPADRPSGTRIYKQNALQTPFLKRGEAYLIEIGLRDHKLEAIEFILKDETRDQWFKLNGGNFRIDIPKDRFTIIPKDLVQQKAYLLWESKGKPKSSPQEEKEDFEFALKELEDQLSKGVALDEIKRNLKVGSDKNSADSRKQERIVKFSTISNSFLPLNYKGHDVSLWINKLSKGCDEGIKVQSSSFLDQVEKTVGTADLKLRQTFNVGNKEVVVLLKKSCSATHMLVAVNFKGLALLHWGVSRQSAGEWLVPPPNVIPESSKLLDGACQSYFKSCSDGLFQSTADGPETAKGFLDEISQREKDAERSLMHRFNIATELLAQCKCEGQVGLIGILVWLRFMASRHLRWNKNYNVKPREISVAQDKFTDLLQAIYMNQLKSREIVRLIMACVGRGSHGDVGQRIRDEILVIQRNNHCKGGMMEEWHQKLHNNSSPDDVIICQALLDYVRSNFEMHVYWRTLNNNGLTRSMLASYDRPIVSEPYFKEDMKEGLIHDLTSYLKTLKAVHSGADLEASIANCLDQASKNQNSSDKVYTSFSNKLEENLRYIQAQVSVQGESIGSLMEKLLESRVELRPLLFSSSGKLKDIIYLDLALDSALRISMERVFNELRNASLQDHLIFVSLMLQNVCLSMDSNEEMVYCTKDWFRIYELYKQNDQQWSFQAKAVLDRMRLTFAEKAECYQKMIQPTARYLGKLLGVDKQNVDLLTEELIRAGSGATLSVLVNHVHHILRKIANLGSWQVISPAEVCGFVTSVHELKMVQSKVYKRPTVIISNKVSGEEEIPEGVVGVVTPDMPDILSHFSIRARNSKVCFATCFDEKILQDLRLKEGKEISIQPTSTGLVYRDIVSSGSSFHPFTSMLGHKGFVLKKKSFGGKYVITAREFTSEMVGAKSCNIQHLKGRVPSWLRTPLSIALPFGAFEATLSSDVNKDLAKRILSLRKLVDGGDLSKLKDIQETVQQMRAPSQLMNEIKSAMKMSKIFEPGDETEERWNKAWKAFKKVWASKWNERAVVSCRKAKLNHDDISMAVLIQELISADYAFVVHTKNPISGDFSEIYTEIVKGLGETLVGAYPGRAMSFITKKSDIKSHVIVGYPSKQIGLFIEKSIIFRSDSNGEDLEGYAGAGLYDSVTLDKGEKVVLDYSSDQLICDKSFRNMIFSKVAEAGKIIEGVFGSAQDIEGVIKDGEIYIVQARPQL